jgi:hypothetical protein
MSHHYHAYEQTVIKHAELMAQAEVERQLKAAEAERPGPIVKLRVALGKLLISAGESLSQVAQTPGRA